MKWFRRFRRNKFHTIWMSEDEAHLLYLEDWVAEHICKSLGITPETFVGAMFYPPKHDAENKTVMSENGF